MEGCVFPPISWPSILANESDTPYSNLGWRYDTETSTVFVRGEVEYVVRSIKTGNDASYGVTWVLSNKRFESDGASVSNVPSLCSNKDRTSYEGRVFSEWWDYSLTPDTDLGDTRYLEYGPSDLWSQSVVYNNSICPNVQYTNTWTINVLEHCCQDCFVWDTSDSDYLIFSGYFFITLVSPIDMSQNLEQYFVYTTSQAHIVLKFLKPETLDSNFETNLLQVRADGELEQIILTIQTSTPKHLYYDTSNPLLLSYSDAPIAWTLSQNLLQSSDCYATDDNRCIQLWTLIANISDLCALDENVIDISHSPGYVMRFNSRCASDNEDDVLNCQADWNSNNPQGDTHFVVSVPLTYSIPCSFIYSVFAMTSTISYFTDSTFTTAATSLQTYTGSDFVFATSRVNPPGGNTWDIIDGEFKDIWICISAIDSISVIDSTGIGGCANDQDVTARYQLTRDGSISDIGTQLQFNVVNQFVDSNTNAFNVQFSFQLPADIAMFGNQKLFIQVNSWMALVPHGRRRELLNGVGNSKIQISSSLGSINLSTQNSSQQLATNSIILISGTLCLALIIILLIGYIWRKKKRSSSVPESIPTNVVVMNELQQPKPATNTASDGEVSTNNAPTLV